MTTKATDHRTVTDTQRKTWSRGDFHEIARHNVVMAERLCPAVGLHAGERVLDVACGSGTAALVAARHYAEVTGIDYVPDLLERARTRAAAEGYELDLRVADAQDLPFDDDNFDVVLSVYGVQFAPDQERAANELLRVCRPGGRIGLASPMPTGWSGDLFATHARHAPPPPGIESPLRWGTEDGMRQLLDHGVSALTSEPQPALQYYRSVEHAVEVFSTWFGPTLSALERVGPDGRDGLIRDLTEIFHRYNRATDGTAVVENTYLQTTARVAPA
ncbi:SAM-dependent methyltransferase [Lipingzhangella halophila]|uniref:SAM-dependent methyltransferase n=1 Tax=Lipingzhangella halophila TaxID=1783352 RepID=A0A7W7RFR5_9ACTN|nr:class I SAM-dependent methyltransferase [Lipingzhangella halophila]MBB4930596.1 SAM-dependent methyltransferase [Lipingzhangella halophila]